MTNNLTTRAKAALDSGYAGSAGHDSIPELIAALEAAEASAVEATHEANACGAERADELASKLAVAMDALRRTEATGYARAVGIARAALAQIGEKP